MAALKEICDPYFKEMLDASMVAETFVDKDRFRINMATLWAAFAAEPNRYGFEDWDLEPLQTIFDQFIAPYLGQQGTIVSCFEFLVTKEGERCLDKFHVPPRHKEFLYYMAAHILEPPDIDPNDED